MIHDILGVRYVPRVIGRVNSLEIAKESRRYNSKRLVCQVLSKESDFSVF